MDALDVGIIRAMGIRPYERVPKPLDALQPARIARVTGANVNTVKDRIARMTECGIIAGYYAVPNLQHLGLRGEAYHFRFPSDEAKDAAQPRHFYSHEMPRVKRALTPLDWRILQALRADPRALPTALAPAIGVSARTVKRRLARLAATGAFSTFARLHEKFHDEILLCALAIRVDESVARDALTAIHVQFLADAWTKCGTSNTHDGAHYDLIVAPRSPSGLAKLLEDIARVPGVREVQGHLAARAKLSMAWIDVEMERALPVTAG